MLEIRFAEIRDSEAIAKLLCDSFGRFASDYTPQALKAVTPTKDEIAGRLDEGPVWVAVSNGQIVGSVSALLEPDWLYIRSMAVAPKAQGLGIGNSLLQVVESYAFEKGFDRLFLYTTYFSQSAIRLYEKNGFCKVRDTTAEEWFGTPGLAMEKNIGIKINAIGS